MLCFWCQCVGVSQKKKKKKIYIALQVPICTGKTFNLKQRQGGYYATAKHCTIAFWAKKTKVGKKDPLTSGHGTTSRSPFELSITLCDRQIWQRWQVQVGTRPVCTSYDAQHKQA